MGGLGVGWGKKQSRQCRQGRREIAKVPDAAHVDFVSFHAQGSVHGFPVRGRPNVGRIAGSRPSLALVGAGPTLNDRGLLRCGLSLPVFG
jgi:hypothetical protein